MLMFGPLSEKMGTRDKSACPRGQLDPIGGKVRIRGNAGFRNERAMMGFEPDPGAP